MHSACFAGAAPAHHPPAAPHHVDQFVRQLGRGGLVQADGRHDILGRAPDGQHAEPRRKRGGQLEGRGRHRIDRRQHGGAAAAGQAGWAGRARVEGVPSGGGRRVGWGLRCGGPRRPISGTGRACRERAQAHRFKGLCRGTVCAQLARRGAITATSRCCTQSCPAPGAPQVAGGPLAAGCCSSRGLTALRVRWVIAGRRGNAGSRSRGALEPSPGGGGRRPAVLPRACWAAGFFSALAGFTGSTV